MLKKIMNKFFKQESKMTDEKPAAQPAIQNIDAKKESSPADDSKISFDDFAKVETTVGEIVSAEKVENADRLLRLEVMFGEEKRQIVSGIADFFAPEEIVGRKCPFVTNLAPRTIRGLESNGMILAAKDADGNFSLLDVDQKIKSGTRLG